MNRKKAKAAFKIIFSVTVVPPLLFFLLDWWDRILASLGLPLIVRGPAIICIIVVVVLFLVHNYIDTWEKAGK